MSYHSTVREIYRRAAEAPARSLCCVSQTPKYLPGLCIPSIMHEMNYGCGSTIHLQDMSPDQTVLYVGVGGGLEALQFAYFARQPGGVVAVDPVAEMRQAAAENLKLAAEVNDWFDPSFVEIRDGDALNLPVDDGSVHVAAQNCLFNIFKVAGVDASPHDNGERRAAGDLEQALAEMRRALVPAGRLVMSDPVSTRPIPRHLREDEVLRAQCVSGCLPLSEYLARIVAAGFGSIEIRSRRPYRMLDAQRFGLDRHLMLESVEVCAYNLPAADDGPCIFTGRVAIYTGDEEAFDDGRGHVLARDVPLPVCDKTAAALAGLGRDDLTLTESTWHYSGGGYC